LNVANLLARNINITKNFEDDLPETYIHDEQVKFILNSILQYAIVTTPGNGTIGFLTRSKTIQKGVTEEKIVTLKERQCVEILTVITLEKGTVENLESLAETLVPKEKETTNLLLKLIQELVQKHQGIIDFNVYERKSKRIISLGLPVERRQVTLYEHINL